MRDSIKNSRAGRRLIYDVGSYNFVSGNINSWECAIDKIGQVHNRNGVMGASCRETQSIRYFNGRAYKHVYISLFHTI